MAYYKFIDERGSSRVIYRHIKEAMWYKRDGDYFTASICIHTAALVIQKSPFILHWAEKLPEDFCPEDPEAEKYGYALFEGNPGYGIIHERMLLPEEDEEED